MAEVDLDGAFCPCRQIPFVGDLVGFRAFRVGDSEGPRQNLQGARLRLGDVRSRIWRGQLGRAKPVQKLIGKEGRLSDALVVQQAEAAMKRREARSGFLEDVGDRKSTR